MTQTVATTDVTVTCDCCHRPRLRSTVHTAVLNLATRKGFDTTMAYVCNDAGACMTAARVGRVGAYA